MGFSRNDSVTLNLGLCGQGWATTLCLSFLNDKKGQSWTLLQVSSFSPIFVFKLELFLYLKVDYTLVSLQAA